MHYSWPLTAGQRDVADERVVDDLGAAAMEPDVVSCPLLAELLAARGQHADEVGQRSIVGVAPGLNSRVWALLSGDDGAVLDLVAEDAAMGS